MNTLELKYRPGRKDIRLIVGAILMLSATVVDARALDNIRLSRVGTKTTTEIELGCAMRYINHAPAAGGVELRVRVALGYDCRLALRGTWSDLRRPIGRRMANLSNIEFDRADAKQGTITLRFEKPVGFEINQTANEYLLTVVVETSAVMPPQRPSPAQAADIAESAEIMPSSKDRSPTRLVQRPPTRTQNRFVIRVAELNDRNDIDFAALAPFRSRVIYTNEISVDQRRWAELRLGFFDTEAEAQQVLTAIRRSFTSSWITVANAEEQAGARARLFEWQDTAPANRDAATPEATATVTRSSSTLSGEQVETMMNEARAALLRHDYAESIRLYAHLLQEPAGDHRQAAREFLGVAREKSGQPARARAEYEAYLVEFPNTVDAKRVQQRLAALTVPRASPSAQAVLPAAAVSPPEWQFYGGASQFYLRGVNLAEDNEPDFVSQSAVLSQAQLIASRRGERFDILARANLGYLYDLVEDGSGDQGLVSHAYIGITDTRSQIHARIGRQTGQSGGVLGRFDGAHVSYRYRPNLSVNVTAGFPIDSPRFLADSDHYFYGASIDLDNVAGVWDFSLFANTQNVDGILDRQAVGAETQYHGSRLNVIGLLDYDASYNVINTALLIGNWRIHDRLTVFGRIRGGAAPFLTTRNAIIGQPVNTVRELLQTYSEGQVRRLARNRTADERTGTAGLTAALTPRLQLHADVSYHEYSATVASGNVAAYPETGPQYSYGGHLLGSGFFRPGNVFTLGYRHDETKSVDSETLFMDLRFPVGDRLRINSRLSATRRIADQNPAGDIEHWIANPMLRVWYTWKRRYRVELEIGGQWSDREMPIALAPPLTPDGVIEITDYYVQLGYTVDF